MNPIEIAAAVFGVLYVILAVKSNPWCWIAGIISAFLYIIFDIQLKYFLDAILQTYYVAAGVYGWYLWTSASIQTNGDEASKLPISTHSFRQLLPLIILGLALVPLLGYTFSKAGNANPYIDSATAVFSFIATYLTAKKILQSWQMWVAIDLVLIVQYFLKNAYVTSGFYLFLTVMAVYGYFEWKKSISQKGSITPSV